MTSEEEQDLEDLCSTNVPVDMCVCAILSFHNSWFQIKTCMIQKYSMGCVTYANIPDECHMKAMLR